MRSRAALDVTLEAERFWADCSMPRPHGEAMEEGFAEGSASGPDRSVERESWLDCAQYEVQAHRNRRCLAAEVTLCAIRSRIAGRAPRR